mgnify:CR=1 FL=1
MKKTRIVSLTGTALCMALGLVLPLLFHLIGAGPVFLPMHIPVLLCGLLTGVFYRRLRWNVYPALIGAMLGGRIVSGAANAVLLGAAGKPYGFGAFLSASFVEALPGIAIQIVLIPVVVLALERAKIFRREQA